MSVYLSLVKSELFYRPGDEGRIEKELQSLLGDDVWILGARVADRAADDGPDLMRCGIGDSEFDQWPAGERQRSIEDDIGRAVTVFEPGSHIDVIDQDEFMLTRIECRTTESGTKAAYRREFDPFFQQIPWGPARKMTREEEQAPPDEDPAKE